MSNKKKRKNPSDDLPPAKRLKTDNNEINTNKLDKIVNSLYQINKNDKLHFGWICLRSATWKELPTDLSHFISLYLTSEPKIILFMDNITTEYNANIMVKLIIDTFWQNIGRNKCGIKSITYNNKQYRERSNTSTETYSYFNFEEVLMHRPEYDEDIMCHCNEGENVLWEIKPDNPDDVTYEYGDINDRKPVLNVRVCGYGEVLRNEEEVYIFNTLCEIVSEFKIKNIFLGEDLECNREYDIKFINPMGINIDHRGADHCKIYLHCYEHQTIKAEQSVSFRDLVDIYHKSKSHKWDFWYEFYGGCDIEMKCLNATEGKNDKYLLVTLHYGHGS